MQQINKINTTVAIIAISIVIVISLMITNVLLQKVIMSKNIDNALEKGIDPITVRCAYAPETDNVCLAYSLSHKPLEAPDAPQIKKK